MRIFKLPDLGEGLSGAEIREWHVAEGDEIAIDQLLVSVETAKSVMEIPSPFRGRVARLFAKVGDTVAVGKELVGFADPDADTTGSPIRDAEPPHKASTPPPVVQKTNGDTVPEGGRAKMLPNTRLFATERKVDPDRIRGTGDGGIVTKNDVARASAQHTSDEKREERLTGIRKVMAEAMTLAHQTVVPVTVMDDADIEDWKDRKDFLPRLIRAVVAGVRAEPAVNAHYDHARLVRTCFERVHTGIAVDMSEGLLVPVLHNADTYTPDALRPALDALIEGARGRTLAPEQLRGATITLSNYGSIRGRYGTPVVIPPTVAILGAGRIYSEPALRNDTLANRRKLPLSLSFDHRALTGGEASRFLAGVIADLEKSE